MEEPPKLESVERIDISGRCIRESSMAVAVAVAVAGASPGRSTLGGSPSTTSLTRMIITSTSRRNGIFAFVGIFVAVAVAITSTGRCGGLLHHPSVLVDRGD